MHLAPIARSQLENMSKKKLSTSMSTSDIEYNDVSDKVNLKKFSSNSLESELSNEDENSLSNTTKIVLIIFMASVFSFVGVYANATPIS